jgi:O-methyltransferase
MGTIPRPASCPCPNGRATEAGPSVEGFYDWLAAELGERRMPYLNYGWVDPVAESADVGLHESLLGKVLQDVELDGCRVLEVGCGRGGNCAWLIERGAALVVGLDPCLGGLRQALPGPSHLAARAERLPCADASFDVVLSVEASHAYPDLGRFIEEVSRVLRPGGTLCWADLWRVEALGLDWGEREAAFHHPGFDPINDLDLSEGVFRALRHPAGLPAALAEAATPRTHAILSAVIHNLEVFRLHLAAGEADYRMRQLRRR